MRILNIVIVVVLSIFFLLAIATPIVSSLATIVGFIPSILITIIIGSFLRLFFRNMNLFPKSSGEMDTMVKGFALDFYVGYMLLALLFVIFLNKCIKSKKLWLKIVINIIIVVFLYAIIQYQAETNGIPSVLSAIVYMFP